MTDRDKLIIRACLIYGICNLDDINFDFEKDLNQNETGLISVNGEVGPYITEEELERLITELQ